MPQLMVLCCVQHSKKGKEMGKKKSSKSKANGEEGAEPAQPFLSALLDFDLAPAATVATVTRLKPLAEDGNLKMVCVCVYLCVYVCVHAFVCVLLCVCCPDCFRGSVHLSCAHFCCVLVFSSMSPSIPLDL